MLTQRDHQVIIALASAGLLKQTLKLTYKYLDHRKGQREAIFRPSHFVKGVRGQADRLHVVGYDYEAEGIRQFAVSNIISIELEV